MKKVLVTGADGFIGSHLVEYLLGKGMYVRALSQYNSFNYWGWLEDIKLSSSLEVITGDIRDPFFCEGLTEGIDTVFHLAALIAIPFSYVAPAGYIETNINGTLNILQASKKSGVEKIVVTSTSEVYGTANYVPIDEKHPKQPQSPYSASKIGADAIALSYYHSFGLPVAIARPFNTFGPRQSARALIPTIITQLLSGAGKIRLGDLTPTRDFNFVEDICSGFYSIALSGDTIGRELNISTGTEVSAGELFQTIRELMGSDTGIESDESRKRPANSEVYRLCGDSGKLRSITGWEPVVSLREGLKRTIDWYSDKRNLDKYKPGIYNM
ncbi:MAG: NAD-dependent epimerase/dehydratase family protein [Bacteroidia bacterium]|nr:MAG: NAD-dependent epimerase/dehydratase family protein [Bacteroidia bacterium]